jgi:hypothetical protein
MPTDGGIEFDLASCVWIREIANLRMLREVLAVAR